MVNWHMVGAMVLPNVGGWAGALTMTGEVKSANGTAWYESIRKPKWNPPNWVFGPAWTALYSSMGFASYLVYRDCGGLTGNTHVHIYKELSTHPRFNLSSSLDKIKPIPWEPYILWG